MRRLALVAVSAGLLLLGALGAGVVGAHGVSPAQLSRAGWHCENVPGLGVHCFPPGSQASDATITAMVFDTSDPTATDAPFVGTELLLRADLYNGQPCPQEGEEEYAPLDLTGDGTTDYYACHHRSSS